MISCTSKRSSLDVLTIWRSVLGGPYRDVDSISAIAKNTVRISVQVVDSATPTRLCTLFLQSTTSYPNPELFGYMLIMYLQLQTKSLRRISTRLDLKSPKRNIQVTAQKQPHFQREPTVLTYLMGMMLSRRHLMPRRPIRTRRFESHLYLTKPMSKNTSSALSAS